MSGFNWDDHPIVQPSGKTPEPAPSSGGFSWDDHPIIQAAPKGPESNNLFGPGGKVPAFLNEHEDLKEFTKKALETLPMAGAVVGGTLGAGAGAVESIPTAGIAAPVLAVGQGALGAATGGAGGKALENTGKQYLLGEAKDSKQQLKEGFTAAKDSAEAQVMGETLGAGIKAVAEVPGVQKAAAAVGRGASKVGEILSGVPAKVIRVFAKNADEIKQMAKASDNSTAEAADTIRQGFQESINKTRGELNTQISTALKDNPTKVDGNKIIKAIEDSKASIDPDLEPEQIAKVNDLIDKIKKKMSATGEISVADAHNVKRFLQNKASAAYRNPGDIFSVGPEGAKAAKSGAAVARSLVNDSVPEVKAANNQLAELHDIEDNLNSNLIAEGKPESALVAAGSGSNPRNIKNLQRLGEATGTDMVSDAEKLAAMKTFGNASLSPNSSTGKTLYHVGAGSVIGGAAGYAEGGRKGAVGGMIAGSMLSSPAAIKAAINSGIITGNVAKGFVLTPAGRALMGQLVMPESKNQDTPAIPKEADSLVSTPAQYKVPTKGPEKWASDGFDKLTQHGAKDLDLEQLMKDPKSKELLIQASDLKPGSKAMQRVLDKIKERK